MTVNDLIVMLNNVPGFARVYTSDPSGWPTEATEVIVHYDKKLNQTWVELVESDD